MLLRFEDGTRGVFTVSQVSAGRKNRLSFEINGSKSSAFWNQEEPEKLWIGHREKPNEGVLSMPFWKVMPQANGLMWTIQIKRGNAK
ncbi:MULTISPECIES: hypothetical protein [Paenibacillus]|uniref:hypothetical protein n=1 Tax=Paenibacillus TaxID=44249 RepID=UPI0020C6DF28|nr:hypothetical protein [Paenibacillus sp. JMULE4]